MNSKKIFIISGVIIVFLGLIIFIIIAIQNIKKDQKQTIESINYIKEKYKILSDNVPKYNKMRSNYIEASKVLILDDYESVYEGFTNFMKDYNDLIKEFDNDVTLLDSKCDKIYPDKETNDICGYYKELYEKIVNLYINDIKEYNKFIASYNEYKQVEVPLIELVHKDYIDYNNDNFFEGASSNE